MEAANKFGEYEKAVLIAWASEDKIFPTSDAKHLHEFFPNSNLVFIDDSYSYIHEDQPSILFSHIQNFIELNPL